MSTDADTARRRQTPPQADALDVENLDVTYRVRGRDLRVVRDVSLPRSGAASPTGSSASRAAASRRSRSAIVRYLARNGTREPAARSRSTAATCSR